MMVTISVNKKPYTLDVEPDTTLADALRTQGFLSVKTGCNQGVCGCCTVWVDEVPMLSCSLLCIRMEGKEITTIEGVAQEAQRLGAFLAEEGSDQCGFCEPGFIMQALAIKNQIKIPASEQELDHLMAGNLCRCSGYRSKIRGLASYLNHQDNKQEL
ncbi:MAG: 2Fe-2S iron-sulfur cluster binding domain-containing protein [Spirochaetia bacterium]|nr:2Fe-2S iron-sulfur cluster binding domain-containing protein [Spirochaetia bacterium]